MSKTNLFYRYETGSLHKDCSMEKLLYFSKKAEAVRFLKVVLVKDVFEVKAVYIFDRTLGLTQWFDGEKWTHSPPSQNKPIR